jgi:hypothetical protein
MLLVPILALALAQPVGPQSASSQTYAACLATPDPVVCVADLAVAGDRGLELTDLIAAGAVDAARRQAPARGRRIVELAARIAAGEGHEGLSPLEAQHVLAVLSDVSFYDSGLPGDARAIGLWDIAMREPVGDIELRGMLVEVASSSDRQDIVRRLVTEAPVDGPWSDDARATFASLAAWHGDDWRVAESFLDSGGDRVEGYLNSGIPIGIDQARLRSGYEGAAAARVLADILSADERLPWPERGAEDRTNDFGLASWAYEAAGDRDSALSAAREGAALTPLAVAERLSLYSNASSVSPSEAAEIAGFGTWPVQRLYELGARDEALAVGYLAGRDRYLAEIEAGVTPDPSWLAKPRIDYQLKLVVPVLQQRRAESDAKALLLRLQAVPADWASANAEELMMLAAIAGEGEQVEAIFNDAVRALDESEDMATWAALQLVIGRRAADAELRRDRTNPQSP